MHIPDWAMRPLDDQHSAGGLLREARTAIDSINTSASNGLLDDLEFMAALRCRLSSAQVSGVQPHCARHNRHQAVCWQMAATLGSVQSPHPMMIFKFPSMTHVSSPAWLSGRLAT